MESEKWRKPPQQKPKRKQNQNRRDEDMRIKRKKACIEITYLKEKKLLKVTKAAGKHLQVMGYRENNAIWLYVEETLWLLENAWAVLLDEDGTEIAMPQALSLSSDFQFEQYKYEVYKKLRNTGMVVLRPRHSNLINIKHWQEKEKEDVEMSPSGSKVSTIENVPQETIEEDEVINSHPPPLLNWNNFPTYYLSRRDGMHRTHLIGLHQDPLLVNFLEGIGQFDVRAVLKVLPRPNYSRDNKATTSWMRHYSRVIRNVTNWNEYNAILKEKNRHRPKRYIVTEKKPPVNVWKDRKSKWTSQEVDFHVFSPFLYAHSAKLKPMFGVRCIDAQSNSVGPMDELRNVVFAIHDGNKISFLTVSNDSIDLSAANLVE